MIQLFIPHLGDELILTSDWTLRLFQEHRNDGFLAALGITRPSALLPDFWQVTPAERQAALDKSKWRLADGSKCVESQHTYGNVQQIVTIPAGALLTIDRIFIRKGAANFDSVTFWLKAKQRPVTVNGKELKKSYRFWAKLDDVNDIEFEKTI